MGMNPKERVVRAIERTKPDRAPLEGVSWGEWSYPFLQKLLNYLGIRDVDTLANKLGIDFRGVKMEPPTEFRNRATNNPLFHYPWGIVIGPDILEDEWGVKRTLNATKLQSRIMHHPLQRAESLEGYHFPDPEAPGRFDTVEKLLKGWRDRYSISASLGGDNLFCQAWYIRGFTDFIRDLYANPRFAEGLLDGLLKVFLGAAKRFAEMEVDILCIADDVAMQTGMIISPHLWRKYMKPRLKKLIDSVKGKGMYVLFHTDGNCEAIIEDLIDVGVDILNPVQPECMDPARIKRLYGDRLTLSGTISIQKTLPYGTLQDVEREVMTRIRTCGYDGGLIIAPSNQVLLDTKMENFLAVYETTKKYGQYPLK